MNMLDAVNSLQTLVAYNVVLTGDWVLNSAGEREWIGEAVAEIPIVGIIFLSRGNRIYWAKSDASSAVMTPQFNEIPPESHKLPMRIYLQDTSELNVQFVYTLGLVFGISDGNATLSSKDYLPKIPHSRTVQTGHLFTFASFDSTPAVTLYTLFLAKQDVKVRRKLVWGLRKPLLEELTSPLREVLVFGRKGELVI